MEQLRDCYELHGRSREGLGSGFTPDMVWLRRRYGRVVSTIEKSSVLIVLGDSCTLSLATFSLPIVKASGDFVNKLCIRDLSNVDCG